MVGHLHGVIEWRFEFLRYENNIRQHPWGAGCVVKGVLHGQLNG